MRFPRPRGGFLALITSLALIAALALLFGGPAGRVTAPAPDQQPSAAGQLSPARESLERFFSTRLGQEMPYLVFLPPGYDSGSESYPVLYMLHGFTASHIEWQQYGLFDQAERLILAGEIPPFLIVLPEGDDSYWVDHAAGLTWGQYVAIELVQEIDERYRTIATRDARAIGGLSMGGDGALQLALNFPDVFATAGAHSPVLRPYEIAPAYFGSKEYWAQHAPVPFIESNGVNDLDLWLDLGDQDGWRPNVEELRALLLRRAIPHEWRLWPGGHDKDYWTEHVPDYLRFYGAHF